MNSSCTSASDFIFVDAIGKNYAVKDVSAAGDCTLLSLLGNPNSVPRETLVDFVLDAIAEINRQNF